MGKPHSILYGISISEIARICRVSLKTAHRWKAGQYVPGYCELAMLSGDLGYWDKAWEGWVLRDGCLISPEGISSTPGEVRGIPFMNSALAAYQSEFRRIREETDALEEQPGPADWEVQITA